ncbi:MAG: hypothetical protein AB7J46_05745 [Candidatus Altimarinota bacterium]
MQPDSRTSKNFQDGYETTLQNFVMSKAAALTKKSVQPKKAGIDFGRLIKKRVLVQFLYTSFVPIGELKKLRGPHPLLSPLGLFTVTPAARQSPTD